MLLSNNKRQKLKTQYNTITKYFNKLTSTSPPTTNAPDERTDSKTNAAQGETAN